MKAPLIVLCALFLSNVQLFSQEAGPPTIEELEQRLEKDAEDRFALYNLGLMRYMAGDYARAVEPWQKLKELEAEDWQLRTKLMQAYSAIGEFDKVEEEVKAIRDARASGKYRDLTEAEFFIRDQIVIDDVRVYVFDYYELKGDRALVWKFLPTKDNKGIGNYISVGSYNSTTAIMRETGEIAKDGRAYHLDGYWSNGRHATYGIFKTRPDYEWARNTVIKILKGEQDEISSSGPALAEPKPDK